MKLPMFAVQALADATPIEVLKTKDCGCCLAWMEYLSGNGFAPTGEDMPGGALGRFKLDSGAPRRRACSPATPRPSPIISLKVTSPPPMFADFSPSSQRPSALRFHRCRSALRGWTSATSATAIKSDGTTKVYSSYDEN